MGPKAKPSRKMVTARELTPEELTLKSATTASILGATIVVAMFLQGSTHVSREYEASYPTMYAYGISPSRATMMICAHLLWLGQLIGLAASFGPSQSTMLAVASSSSLGSAASREAFRASLSILLGSRGMVSNFDEYFIPSVEVV